jgi:hypothetical protein
MSMYENFAFLTRTVNNYCLFTFETFIIITLRGLKYVSWAAKFKLVLPTEPS